MTEKRMFGDAPREGRPERPGGVVSVPTEEEKRAEVAAMITVVYGLLRLRATPSEVPGTETASWFERRETTSAVCSWRGRSLAASGSRGSHRA